jgi:endonuclease V-like protein UPF0215 family
MKSGARIVAIEGAPFVKSEKKALAVGVIVRQGVVEGVISFYVSVDGSDAIDEIAKHIESSRFKDQLKLIALNGITIAGLNIIDIFDLSKKTGMPVVAITRRKPHVTLLKRAIKSSGINVKEKLKIIQKISSIKAARIGGFYVQPCGIQEAEFKDKIGMSVEALRLAHIIASGISRGESKGRI